MTYPKVLFLSLERINSADKSNNGLLLRNLFGTWPKGKLFQIYSSGDNGDEGFCGHYYQLGSEDRRFGRLFYKLKNEALYNAESNGFSYSKDSGIVSIISALKCYGKRILMETGLYELIFRPCLSDEMVSWVETLKPDVIFAQGYNLTFTWLPLMLQKVTRARLVFFTTDDWPTYLYSGQLGEPKIFKWVLRPAVKRATHQLFASVDVPLAFGQPMADEYTKRYNKVFITLSHSDDPCRFEKAIPHRCHPEDVFSILTIGNFNRFRWPLLLDMNECCRLLSEHGINARVAVLSAGIDPAGLMELNRAEYIDILEDPGNDYLPSYLKGSDLLFLAEGFDEGFASAIRLSVTSKSHLFMFSQRPIVVYGHPDTGVVKYAMAYKWAYTVEKRDIQMLFKAVNTVIHNKAENENIIKNAMLTAEKFHLRELNQFKFFKLLESHICGNE